MKKRLTIVICALAAVFCQALFVMPQTAQAAAAGESLTIRVQYAMEAEEKIREKVTYSNAELAAMGASTLRYSNLTNVGTILGVIARGPKVLTILDNAGIDLNSIQCINFRTTDGTGEHSRYSYPIYVDRHLTSARYYYPHLKTPTGYERHEDDTLTPLPGSLSDRQSVPAILALESFSTKQPSRVLEPSDMRTDESYRFCLGQPPVLQEGVKTKPGYDGGDVTAMESAQFIFGIDVTLYGSPVEGIKLDLDDKNLKVGSKAKISAVIEGDELFADDWGFDLEDLEWSSSDTDIAEVDQSGTVTIKKEGEVTITAKAPNGLSASVTINATEGAAEDEKDKTSDDRSGAAASTKKDGKAKPKKAKAPVKIVVKEVKIGGKIEEDGGEQAAVRKQMADDAQALDKAEETNPYVVFASAYTAILILAFGAVFRIRRYFKEV